MQKQIRIVLLVALLALALACVLGVSTSAKEWNVTDVSSLTGAITSAADGDSIWVADDIEVTSPLSITKSLTFAGDMDRTLSSTGRLFDVSGNYDVTLTLNDMNFTAVNRVVNNTGSGHITIVVDSCTLFSTGNSAVYLGGHGVQTFTGENATIKAINATAGSAWYGIACFGNGVTTIDLTDCALQANNGCIHLERPATINISGGTLSNNTAGNSGFGLIDVNKILASGSEITISGSAVISKTVGTEGAIRLSAPATVSIGSSVTVTSTTSAAVFANHLAWGSTVTVADGATLTGDSAAISAAAPAAFLSAAGSGSTVYTVGQPTTGTVHSVSTQQELRDAVTAAADGDTIKLTANITLDTNEITLSGGKSLTFTADSAITLSQSTASKTIFTIGGNTAIKIAGYLQLAPSNNYRVIYVNSNTANVVMTVADHAVVSSKNNMLYVANTATAVVNVEGYADLHTGDYSVTWCDAIEILNAVGNAQIIINIKDNVTVDGARHAVRLARIGTKTTTTGTLCAINVSGGTLRSHSATPAIEIGSYNAGDAARAKVTMINVTGGAIANGTGAAQPYGAVDFNNANYKSDADWTVATNIFRMTGGTITSSFKSGVAFRQTGDTNYCYIAGDALIKTTYTTGDSYRGVVDFSGNSTLCMTDGELIEQTVNVSQNGIVFRQGTHAAYISGGTVAAGYTGIHVWYQCSKIDLTLCGDAEVAATRTSGTGYGVLLTAKSDGSVIRVADDAAINAYASSASLAMQIGWNYNGSGMNPAGTSNVYITGGTIHGGTSSAAIEVVKPSQLQTMSITGAALQGSSGVVLAHPATLNIGAGTTFNTTAAGVHVSHTADGSFSYTKDAVVYNSEAIEFDGSTINITGGTFTVGTLVNVLSAANTPHTVTVNGVTVTGGSVVRSAAADAEITVNGGNFAGCSAIVVLDTDSTGTVTIGAVGVSMTLPTSGKLYQLAAVGDTEPTVTVEDEIIIPWSLDELNFYDTEEHAAAGVIAYIGTFGEDGCQYYGSLAGAIAAAEDGDTIVVYRSEVQSASLNISLAGSLTITSTNAVTISYSGDVFTITGNTNLTLNGNVTYDHTGNVRVICVNTASITPTVTLGGNVVLRQHGTTGGHAIWLGTSFTGGSITINVQDNATLTSADGLYDCVYSNGSCTSAITVNVTGGTLAAKRSALHFDGTGAVTVNVTGGTLSAASANTYGVIEINRAGGTVSITGGTITAASTGKAIGLTQSVTANVYGGTLTGRLWVNHASAVLNVFGGTFNQGSGNADLASANAGTLNVYGGSFTLAGSTGTVFTEGTGTVNLACGYVIRGGETYFTGEEYADPENKVYTGNTITRDTGAQVRMIAESAGLRFISHIDAETVAAVEGITGVSGVKYFTIIFPAEHVASLGGNVTPANIFATLTEGGQYAKKEADEGKVSDGEGGWYIRTALVGIKNYTRDFACVAYIQYTVNGQTMILSTAFSAGNDVRNVQDVAQAALDAYDAGTVSYNATQLAILTEFAENDGPTPAAMLVMAPAPAIRKEYV